ncbi:MAG: hypothetical protein ABI782_06770 [Anaerolineaceae bacterium]
MKRLLILFAGLAVAAAGLVGFMRPSESAAAGGPCSVTGAALDSEETQFLSLLQQWRSTNVAHPTPLETSGALNAAAAWFAQWQVDNGGPGGHSDSFGRNWGQRAADCGYDSYFALGGSGEGVYAVAASAALSVGPPQAIAGITYPGSGVRIDTASAGWPAKCVGVAVKRNTAGTIVAWVVVIAQYPAASSCPGASGGAEPPPTSPSPSVSPSSTATKTATPTSTPTKTPIPSPTPAPRTDGATINLSSGWNLVVIPPGNLDEVLYRAKACFRSVYQQQGERWVRYSPVVPAYARNLQTSDGGVFWVEGTAEGCGVVPL